MEKCDCYKERTYYTESYYDPMKGQIVGEYRTEPYCSGRKEQERCSCGGDKAKCNFYEHVRKEGLHIMNFAEAWLEAQKNNKWYINKFNGIAYNKNYGLVEENDLQKPVKIEEFDNGIESIMNAEWKIWRDGVMSKEEAEKEFGIKIID